LVPHAFFLPHFLRAQTLELDDKACATYDGGRKGPEGGREEVLVGKIKDSEAVLSYTLCVLAA
jgi:hypothetical protein